MNTIWIMALEPIETRYTCQWFDGIPELLTNTLRTKNALCSTISRRYSFDIENVAGEGSQGDTTAGAFLNFTDTNIWKNTQLNTIARNFSNGLVKPGDRFLFADAWHPGIIQLKYMSQLLDIPVEIHAIWHAGSYDPQDFLGRKIQNKSWSYSFEKSLYHCIDYNYFATEYHLDLFSREIATSDERYARNGQRDIGREHLHWKSEARLFRSGQPHNKLVESLQSLDCSKKRDLILFPHRVAPEKQPQIFRDLAKEMPEYEWVICQEHNLSKNDYHKLLAESKMIFSANLQETLGISAMEGVLVNSMPFVPDRLSYREMYLDCFKYDDKLTRNVKNYLLNKDLLIYTIKRQINNYDKFKEQFDQQREILLKEYLYPGPMIDHLLRRPNG